MVEWVLIVWFGSGAGFNVPGFTSEDACHGAGSKIRREFFAGRTSWHSAEEPRFTCVTTTAQGDPND